MRLARCLALAIALAVSRVPAPSAGEPIVTVTACDQVDVGGQTYPRFTFQVHNTTVASVCVIGFANENPIDPADSCTVVAISGPTAPSGYESVIFGNIALWRGCDLETIGPGETGQGFQIVTTGACCAKVFLIEASNARVATEAVCLQCPTPAERQTWGRVKSRYR
jgi:hypothetical protein